MRVGNLSWPSLNANWAPIYGKISRITLWAFDLRLRKWNGWKCRTIKIQQLFFYWGLLLHSPCVFNYVFTHLHTWVFGWFFFLLKWTLSQSSKTKTQTLWHGTFQSNVKEWRIGPKSPCIGQVQLSNVYIIDWASRLKLTIIVEVFYKSADIFLPVVKLIHTNEDASVLISYERLRHKSLSQWEHSSDLIT